jgi:hypothetical protein
MTRLIIHYGLPRCASTTLQSFFSKNIRQLADYGIDYPNLLGLNEHEVAACDQGNAFSLVYSMLRDKTITNCPHPSFSVADFLEYLSTRPHDRSVLISSEWFTSLDTITLDKFCSVVARRISSISLACVFRSLPDMCLSRYSQRARYFSHAESFPDFFRDWKRWIRPFDAMFTFATAFGGVESNHFILGLDSDQQGSIVSRFSHHVLNLDHAQVQSLQCQPKLNVSVSHLALILQQRMTSAGKALTLHEIDAFNEILAQGFPALHRQPLLSLPVILQLEVFAAIANYFADRLQGLHVPGLALTELIKLYRDSSFYDAPLPLPSGWPSLIADLQEYLADTSNTHSMAFSSLSTMHSSLDDIKRLLD